MNKFRKWIADTGGARHVAVLLGTTERSIYHWKAAINSPNAMTLQKIVTLSKGKVSYQDILDCTLHGKK